MEIYEMVEIEDCPLCEGPAYLEEENGNSMYIMCYECGCHSISTTFKTPEQKLDAAQRVAKLWNSGKVIKPTPGE